MYISGEDFFYVSNIVFTANCQVDFEDFIFIKWNISIIHDVCVESFKDGQQIIDWLGI